MHSAFLPLALLIGVMSCVAGRANADVAGAFREACLRAGLQTGLAVHLAADNLSTARVLSDAGAAVVLVVVDDADRGAEMRGQLAKEGRLGRIGVVDRLDLQRVPLVDEAAVLLVVEEGEQSDQAELMRVVRPYGTLLRGGQATVKSWPEGYDGWYDYYYDASGNEVSSDAQAGPLVGLQWTAGDASTKGQVGFRLVDGILLAAEERDVADGGRSGRWSSHCIVARDAFTGLILWQRPDLKLQNTYAFDVDDQRVYLHPVGEQHQVALDLKTGKTLVAYEQGVTVDPDTYIKRYPVPYWQSMVFEDVLIQVHHSQLVALDTKTGKRLWAHDFGDERLMPYVPIIAGGKLVVIAGQRAEMSWSYNQGWRSMQLTELRSFEPATGKPAWSWRENSRFDLYVQNMSYRDGAIGMLVWAMPEGTTDRRQITRKDGYFGLMCFEPTGVLRWQTVVKDQLGAGHGSHDRCLIADGKLWVTNANRMRGYDLSTGKQVADASAIIAPLCNVIRGTRDLLFHGAGAGSVAELKYWSVTATRPACDTGSYPGFGRLYVSQTNCGCTQFLCGTAAGLPEADTHEYGGPRLQTGRARPAAALSSGAGWPTYFADSQRSLWVDGSVAGLSPAWRYQHADPLATMPAAQRSDWEKNPWRCGPVTAPVAAEGIVAYALTDSGTVVARDMESGQQRWACPVAGRVDSPPTIHKGLVICGTRAGWVYALSRDTGELVWRFLAAPHQRTLIAQGSVESVWPVSGAVTVVDDVVWLNAGRTAETDGGLWIWGLDARSGAVRHRARLDGTMGWKSIKEPSPKHRSYALGQPFIHDSAHDLLLLYDDCVRLKTGELVTVMEDEGLRVPHGPAPPNRLKRPGIRTLVYNGTDEQGKYGVGMNYAGVKAKLIAHRNDRMVALLDNNGVGGRGGGPKSGAVALWQIGDKPLEMRNPAMGRKLWELDSRGEVVRRERGDWAEFQTLAVAGDKIVINHNTKLMLLDLESGKKLDEAELPALPVFSGIAVAGDRIFVTCRDGSAVCWR